MNVRNISLTPRMEEVREPFIIAPIQFELDQIKGHSGLLSSRDE